MSHRTRTSALVVAASLAMTTLCAASPATAKAATPNKCGGVISDFSGTVAPAVPFTGTLTVVIDNNTFKYPITITSQAPNSNILQVNAKLQSDQEVSTTSSFSLEVDNLGRGKIFFQSPTGYGRTTSIHCDTTPLNPQSTRVTQMTGKMTDPTITNKAQGDFTVTRPAL
ncbi:hypothetical protein [Streptomyces spectabilis]|uniref:Uncharacterized protein n=1 Tax=Streptomyces spectabilis TaxID=68270 RepID=A0A5P2XGR8_STRST|nr:hypothetical protein [Streptomyces spectabilis]MBB5109480.1 hypothetical protein [Streptomyces spectabilis]MCI3904649.1 hypothetical protein [Streptomyces spectabilis]QEV61726.1 hypothetical protein CP982_25940 [Streptomyces spectabilis]GGV54642.1 hypothetical protein GCM10010245_86460 [Streptomyces spectabilis]